MKKITALLCIGIPFIIGTSLIIAFGIACSLEMVTNRGIIYSLFASISIIGSLLIPIPGSAFSVIGIINAIKLRKQGEKTLYLILIGIFNIIISLTVIILWLYVLFVGGASV